MQLKERSRQEIQARLASMGYYVKIDYLGRALNSNLDFDARKFVLVELSRLYESRGMTLEAGRLMKNAAEINSTFKSKIQDYIKSVELYIKGGNYTAGDLVFAQALALTTEREKPELKRMIKKFYFDQAQVYVKLDRRNQAKKIYEKLMSIELDASEKKEVQNLLLDLYQKLGNISEYYKLRDSTK